MLFNVFINDMDNEIQCTLSKFADETRLTGTVRTDNIQMYLDKLEQWASMDFMKLNEAKCKVLHLGWGNPKFQYKLED
ncbi:rna-directed dna polymerase from mobile element jockey-like [Limosa lapponica baueri]|uniref:Rna-directed dna polymerase from mobile element jockey-like n=1 Tax=Limosa lapponica baueri TaxID=1758121 RepID=A0A2I0UUI5_LIMLA|nr:rna-directed dna polymerase from mobile element jockey-like [Limosa lapponica baueri]